MANATAVPVVVTTALLTFFTLTVAFHHAHAQGGAVEREPQEYYTLLEPVVVPAESPPLAVATPPPTTADLVCGSCKCCLKNSNPVVCRTSCCFHRTCVGSVCTLRAASCGCSNCEYSAVAGAGTE